MGCGSKSLLMRATTKDNSRQMGLLSLFSVANRVIEDELSMRESLVWVMVVNIGKPKIMCSSSERCLVVSHSAAGEPKK